MGYIYLTAALFAGVAKGFCGKTVSRDMQNFKECIFINLMRMLFCSLIGFLLAVPKCGISSLVFTKPAFCVYLIAGVSMSIFCVSWMYAYRNEAYMFLSIFTMIGTIVTCILDYTVYKTPISPVQWVAMAVLLAAVFIMSVYNKGIKGKMTLRGLMLLIIGSMGSATADFSQKIYVREIGQSAEIFNAYMYLVGFVLLLFVYICTLLSKNGKAEHMSAILYDKKHMWIYFSMSAFLYLNSVTKTLAAEFLTATQIYPVLQGANLILSALMAHFIFKEKLNIKGIAGIVTAFVGLMAMHLA